MIERMECLNVDGLSNDCLYRAKFKVVIETILDSAYPKKSIDFDEFKTTYDLNSEEASELLAFLVKKNLAIIKDGKVKITVTNTDLIKEILYEINLIELRATIEQLIKLKPHSRDILKKLLSDIPTLGSLLIDGNQKKEGTSEQADNIELLLTPLIVSVLEFASKNNQFTSRQLQDEIPASHGIFHRLKDMVEMGLIEHVKNVRQRNKEGEVKRGRPQKLYKITPAGLSVLSEIVPKVRCFVDFSKYSSSVRISIPRKWLK